MNTFNNVLTDGTFWCFSLWEKIKGMKGNKALLQPTYTDKNTTGSLATHLDIPRCICWNGEYATQRGCVTFCLPLPIFM